MIISISGMPGAGKSTVAKILSRRLGMKRYYMGGMRRELARKRGMNLDELNRLGEKEDWTDREVDDYQAGLGRTEDNFIIEGRTSFFLIPHSFKVFLHVDADVGAKRIFEDVHSNIERNEARYRDVRETSEAIRKRLESDRKRYRKYYDMDVFDTSKFDLVIDTTTMKPEEVAEKIIDAVNK
jgi:cytidylate kinase